MRAVEEISWKIAPLTGPHLTKDLIETLEALSPVQLTPDQLPVIFQKMLRDGTKTYVVLVEGRVVATASYFVEQKFIHGGGKVGHIEDVAVHRNYQGLGIGKALVTHLIALIWKEGAYKVILDCEDRNVPFYEKTGFTRHEINMRQNNPSL